MMSYSQCFDGLLQSNQNLLTAKQWKKVHGIGDRERVQEGWKVLLETFDHNGDQKISKREMLDTLMPTTVEMESSADVVDPLLQPPLGLLLRNDIRDISSCSPKQMNQRDEL